MLEDITTGVSLLLVAVVLLITWMYRNIRRPPGMPPGPTPYPIIGNVSIFMGNTPPQEIFRDMTKKYGPIISFKVGPSWAVIINNYELTQEALLMKPNDFSGRPSLHLVNWFSDNQQDIIFAQPTPIWKFHRKLAHSAIRKYATGKYLENLIEDVIPRLQAIITQKAGSPFNPHEVITLAVYNVIASMCFGHKYEFNDTDLLRFIELQKEINEAFGNGTLEDFIPMARFLPSPQVNTIKKRATEFFALIMKEVSQHLRRYSPDEPANDLIELLLQAQREESEESEDNASKLTDVHIKQIVSDLFSAGTDTSSTTLLWAIGCMVDNPIAQEKIKKEIENIIGLDRPPRLSDRGKLPYTEAAIMEIMRFGTVAPLGVTHRALKDSSIGSYMIPENTWVLINQWALHVDPKYWDAPELFQPERFLDASNSVKQRLPSFLPFSTGRRVCVGESLAKAEIFLLFTWLIQNYKFSKPPGVEGPAAVGGFPQGINLPKPYKVIATPRNDIK
ncbi:steroid 17-alpha-hydroxylase/17,20 lyase-like [Anneissia japonica]|uniref:steroid 17-alpha-hydroxylase/17,20 lyase-like n=1 Tax=Anneissia japonica TaxID=1529436 RepID=UPI0014257B01|nr:steroid 17-alpha-hydroxylase/17,20 lyase-like [Anneissia japonica]XP_033120088.1 steroid 17-alpha-hydroxylase/17,20 lyase-like [Anneissia japonica]XP_033120090.1 steroid 17-alpha-hydroxylase/17,20 lyase-like [Anneissia japonica]